MKLVVIGSISMDLVAISDIRPKAGETVIGKDFKTIPGGKGANQAVAASRLSGGNTQVTMLGAVGNDDFGTSTKNNLAKENINVDAIITVPSRPTGTALIILAQEDNSIVVIPGANYGVTKEYIDNNISTILSADMVLLQIEIPIDTVEYIINICYEKGIKTILNPAPAQILKEEIIDKITYLTPNEHEARIIFDDFITPIDEILGKYPNKLIMTVGKEGAMYHNSEKIVTAPGHPMTVVDTTGAGDTFNGALAIGVLEGKELFESIVFANSAAALSVTKLGAQGGMPTRLEMEK